MDRWNDGKSQVLEVKLINKSIKINSLIIVGAQWVVLLNGFQVK